MQVFGVPLSPFVRKTHLVAAEKGIAFETVPVNPREPTADFLAASPFRKMPALRDGDFLLADSTAIVTYFEAIRPDPPVLPAKPKARARAVWFEEFADTIMAPAGAKVVFNRFIAPKIIGVPGDEAAAEQGLRELDPIFAYLETAAPAQGWLTGEDFTIGDIAVATMFKTQSYVGLAPDPAVHPRTAAWFDRVSARPAWRQVAEVEARIAATLGV
jgi:glutathione S-transferase